MTNHLPSRDLVASGKLSDKFLQCVKLLIGRSRFFKIADQADTDTASIEQGVAGVSTVQLLLPAKRCLHLAIPHSIPVTDHKVISNAQPCSTVGFFPLLMLAVNGLHAAGLSCGMMNHQILPRSVRQLPARAGSLRSNRRLLHSTGRWSLTGRSICKQCPSRLAGDHP